MDDREETRTWKILIVDDDKYDYFLARNMLADAKRGKCFVEWASTYQAGRQALARNTYDAVLMDYDLGEKNGLELIREAVANGFQAPFILFTGHGSYEVDQEAMRDGATLYLTKGETSALMLERGIRYAIERKQIEVTLQQKTKELEAALVQAEESQRMLKALMEYIPEGITIANNTDMKIDRVSRYGQEMLGGPHANKTIEEVAAEWKVFYPDGKTPLESEKLPLVKALRTGEVVKDQEVVQVNSAGQKLILSCNAGPIYNAAGEVAGAIVAWRDVSERKRITEDLVRKEAELRDAQRVAHIGSWYWDAQTDVTVGTEELLRIYGLDPAVQGMPDFKEQKGWLYPAETWEVLNAAVQKSLETGVGYELDVEAYHNGEPIWITTRSEAVRDASGRIVGLRGTVQDITPRVRAEQALRESEARFRSVLDNSRDVIYCLNVQTGQFEYISPSAEAVVGYSPAELMALDNEASQAMIHPDDLPAMQAALARLMESGEEEIEYRQRTKAGGYAWLSNHMSITKDRAGRALYRNGNIRDISGFKARHQ